MDKYLLKAELPVEETENVGNSIFLSGGILKENDNGETNNEIKKKLNFKSVSEHLKRKGDETPNDGLDEKESFSRRRHLKQNSCFELVDYRRNFGNSTKYLKVNNERAKSFEREVYKSMLSKKFKLLEAKFIFHQTIIDESMSMNRLSESFSNSNSKLKISDMKFDSVGSILAVGRRSGVISIFDFDLALTRMCMSEKNVSWSEEKRRSENIHFEYFSMSTGKFVIERLNWNPFNENQIAVSSRKSSKIKLYDLTRLKNNLVRNFESSNSSGIGDFAFLHAGDTTGKIFMWDVRVKNPSKCGMGRPGSIKCIEASPCGNLIHSCQLRGLLESWDIRFHPDPIRSIQLWNKKQDDLTIQSMQLDPSNYSNLALQLSDRSVACWDLLERKMKCWSKPDVKEVSNMHLAFCSSSFCVTPHYSLLIFPSFSEELNILDLENFKSKVEDNIPLKKINLDLYPSSVLCHPQMHCLIIQQDGEDYLSVVGLSNSQTKRIGKIKREEVGGLQDQEPEWYNTTALYGF